MWRVTELKGMYFFLIKKTRYNRAKILTCIIRLQIKLKSLVFLLWIVHNTIHNKTIDEPFNDKKINTHLELGLYFHIFIAQCNYSHAF